MSNCSKLINNQNMARCGQFNPGIEPDLILIDLRDIESRTVVDGVLTGLTLKEDCYAVRYQGRRNAYDASYQMQKGSFNNSFLHSITCRTFVRSQAVKCHMNRLPFSRVLVVVRNKDSHDMTMKYEVYGYENGLRMSEIDYTGNADEGWLASFMLSSTEDAYESAMPVTFYNTDPETTFLLLLALTQLEWFTLGISTLGSNMKIG